jgi:hypothetical protein
MTLSSTTRCYGLTSIALARLGFIAPIGLPLGEEVAGAEPEAERGQATAEAGRAAGEERLRGRLQPRELQLPTGGVGAYGEEGPAADEGDDLRRART